MILRPAILLIAVLPLSAQDRPRVIRQIDLFTTAHTDVGYTDQPSITRELQKRFLDVAIDACLRTASRPEGERFYWTAEATMSVLDWWEAASPERREQFLGLVRNGQIDVTALSCNNTPFMDAQEWDKAVAWLPDDLWRAVSPRIAIQDDVNGFPRAGAVRLLDRGITRLISGINVTDGGRPFPAPYAFWWKMPDGRRMLVYLSEHYGTAFRYFHSAEWRGGPSPRAGNTFVRPPRPGEVFRTDEQSLRAAHKVCLQHIAKLEDAGYKLPRVIVSATNQWRWDNDVPFPALADFVAAWNRLGLEPRLRLTTASDALLALQKESGAQLPEHQGEWTDYWANGTASAPRELAAGRLARRLLRAAQSEALGPFDQEAQKAVDQIVRDLVLFDEHTWGSADSISLPDSIDTLAQFAEKAVLAFRPMARAELLLGARMHRRLDREPEGVYVANTTANPMTGWVRFPMAAARREFKSLTDTHGSLAVWFDKTSDRILPTHFPSDPNAAPPEKPQVARFWAQNLPPHSITRFQYSGQAAESAPAAVGIGRVETDGNGWPKFVAWQGMKRPLFLEGLGDFLAVEVAGWPVVAELAGAQGTAEERASKRTKVLKEIPASPVGQAQREETPYTVIYTQPMQHPRLKYFVRRLELWKSEPRARLTIRLYRTSAVAPEVFYVNFPLPAEGVLPVLSSGDMPFVPFQDQLGDTCRDYYAVDGWAHYKTPGGEWLWATRDAALVTIGGPNTLARIKDTPREPNRLMAMIFNNLWDTNFVADSHGAMDFQFDLLWKQKIENPAALAETLAADPNILLNSAAREDPVVEKDLWRP